MPSDQLHKLPIKELRSRCQANAPEAGRDPWVGHTIRFTSVYVTKYVTLRLGLTPNWITVISVLTFFSGISLYFFDDLYLQLLGTFIIWCSIVLDGCDGEMARLRGNPSGVGSIYTEPISHDIMYSLMFIPVAVNLWLVGFPEWILLVGWLATSSKLLHRFLTVRFDKVRAMENATTQSDGEGEQIVPFNPNVPLPHKLYRFLNRNFFSSVGFIIPLTASALAGHLEWFLYACTAFYSFAAVINFLRQTRHITRLSRKNLTNGV